LSPVVWSIHVTLANEGKLNVVKLLFDIV